MVNSEIWLTVGNKMIGRGRRKEKEGWKDEDGRNVDARIIALEG